MTDMPRDLAEAVEAYRTGMAAEVVLLQALDDVAGEQRSVSLARAFDKFEQPATERDRLTAELASLERSMRPVRDWLASRRHDAEQVPAFAEASSLHEQALTIATRILGHDQDALRSLREVTIARRAALARLDQAGTTLAAYRRVTTPPGRSTFVNQRG